MNRGLYINATSLVANQKKLEVLSNNLANVNTTGFKKDMSLTETFPEKLLAKINDKPKTKLPKENEFILNPPTEEGVYTASTKEGYFVVSTPRGKSYVKEIRFIESDGYLKTYYKGDTFDVENLLKTDNENFIADRNGNPIRIEGDGNIEQLLRTNISTPPAHIIGTMNAGVGFNRIVTDFTPGNMVQTGGTLDLAINGDGFFQIQVEGEDGENITCYTRDGSFTIDAQGRLTTLNGDVVQGINGPIEGEEISISSDGTVMVDGEQAGRLDIVVINNKEFLRKFGDNLYRMALDANGEEIPAQTGQFEGQVLQGFLEESNVEAITEMVEMITLFRNFETGQKAIRVQDEMLEKASNEIGRI